MSVQPAQPRGMRTSALRLLNDQQSDVGASWFGTRRRYDNGFGLPKAGSEVPAIMRPAIALRHSSVRLVFPSPASAGTFTSLTMTLRPSRVNFMCTCSPLPAWPTVIFGAKVMVSPRL